MPTIRNEEDKISYYHYILEGGGEIEFKDEHTLQSVCVFWFKVNYPKYTIHSIPNGGKRDIVTAVKLRNEGALSGVPDLFIAAMKGGHGGFYIEMKNGKKGRVEPNQRTLMQKLSEEGYRCEVCRSYEEFKRMVNDYFGKDS
ncbi:MAG: VRR-NUC domain-containing protein [Paludibacteraceae bacterium]|nr:VRR-NUC domain-containing protein [Paludibacteraceae bacterium]